MPPQKDEIETSMRRLKDGKVYNDNPAASLKYAADSKELVKEVTKSGNIKSFQQFGDIPD